MKRGCFKCGGMYKEEGGSMQESGEMTQEDQMLMKIAAMLQKNISENGNEAGVQMTLQMLVQNGLIDESEQGIQQGMSLLEAAVNHVSQGHGDRNISEEGLAQYTSGGNDYMAYGGLHKAQVGEQYTQEDLMGQGNVPVVDVPASPAMGAISGFMNQNAPAKPESMKMPVYNTFENMNAQKYANNMNAQNYANTTTNQTTNPEKAYHVTNYNTLGEQDATQGDKRRLTSLYKGSFDNPMGRMALQADKTGIGQIFSGIRAVSQLPYWVGKSLTAKDYRQDYDSAGKPIGERYEVDKQTQRDERQYDRDVRRKQRQDARSDKFLGNQINSAANAVRNVGQNAYYGLKKFLTKAAEGMTVSKDPCPEGMVWDPIYGCVPLMDQHMQEYSPDQILDYFNKIRKQDAPLIDLYDNILRENPNYFTQPVDDFMLQQYKDNYIPIIDTETGKGFVDYMNLTPDQIRQKKTVDMNYLGDYMKLYNKAGYPPDEWLEQLLHQNDPNKLQNERNFEKEIEFNKQLYDYQNIYEQNMQDCPCRKKQLKPDGTMSEICVPCEQMSTDEKIPMAAYGGSKGGDTWNPFEDNRKKLLVRINKPLFRDGGLPQYQIAGQTRRAWEASQGIAEDPSRGASYYDATWDGTKWVEPVTNTQQQTGVNSKSQENPNMTSPYMNNVINRGADPSGSWIASNLMIGLQDLASGVEKMTLPGIMRQQQERARQYGNTMSQDASNPFDPRAGILAQEFQNQTFGAVGSGGFYPLVQGTAGDIGATYATAKYGGKYEVGGEYDLTDEELEWLRQNGFEYTIQK